MMANSDKSTKSQCSKVDYWLRQHLGPSLQEHIEFVIFIFVFGAVLYWGFV